MALQNTRKSITEKKELLAGVRHLFFIGIGGVHMASLARYAARQGFLVSGSDRVASRVTEELIGEGITVWIGHDAAHLADAEAVIYTLAIDAENPEYRAARQRGLALLSRADFLGWLMSAYPSRIGISGAHGKSTVTAMLAEIFSTAERSPTVFCGAPMPPDDSPLLCGAGRDIIFEACEYQNSFLCFSPTLAVILNIAHDHVDFFPSLADVRESFASFAALVGKEGRVLCSAEDENCAAALSGVAAQRYTFGENGDFTARNLRMREGCASFSLFAGGDCLGRVSLRVAGRHNLQNALAAAGAAHLSGVPAESIVKGLCAFRGAARRLQYRGRWQGAAVYDDYAHHPDEIAATLSAAREMTSAGGRLFVVFQSHTYTRTKAFLGEIAAALRLADRVLVADIYPARERDTLGMSAAVLADAVGERACAAGGFDAMLSLLRSELSAPDLLVVMGAGDIDTLFARIF